jgi:hypothetical protein
VLGFPCLPAKASRRGEIAQKSSKLTVLPSLSSMRTPNSRLLYRCEPERKQNGGRGERPDLRGPSCKGGDEHFLDLSQIGCRSLEATTTSALTAMRRGMRTCRSLGPGGRKTFGAQPAQELIAEEGAEDVPSGEGRSGAGSGNRAAQLWPCAEPAGVDRGRCRCRARAWGWAALCALRIAGQTAASG